MENFAPDEMVSEKSMISDPALTLQAAKKL